jgi:hypothetical protein
MHRQHVGRRWRSGSGCCRSRTSRHKDEEEIVTTKLTYFARMASAATFADQASAEVRRRGIERAKQVCAIQDGAEWIQDGCRKAIGTMRLSILDFAHAASTASQK